jgi:MoaA/NifB/PqqE/SkfB family radical SAM enzyme
MVGAERAPSIADDVVFSGTADAALRELAEAATAGVPKLEYLRLLDSRRDAIYRSMRTAYDSTGFCKLMTLKLSNLALGRYHFLQRHVAPVSRPIQLMADPSNNCHLHCPGCLHTANPSFAGRFPWPGGLLQDDLWGAFSEHYGPYAYGLVLYNWGEPLLNKRTPQMVRDAKRYHLHVCLSSNISLPFDAEAVVGSGLNFLYCSLDGATQATYERFRRGGKLEVCFENLRRLVAARERLGSSVPYILWKYLTFEHNEHEIDLAISTARELGVDEITIATPVAVDWDDPSVRAVDSPKAGVYVLREEASFRGPLDAAGQCELDESFLDGLFDDTWVARAHRSGLPLEEPNRPDVGTCRWLYQSTTIDAQGNIYACCMPPERSVHRVYGRFPDEEPDAFNARDMVGSRLAFADADAFDAWQQTTGRPRPYCADCREDPALTYTVSSHARRDVAFLDPLGVLDPTTVERLTTWPRNRP